MALFFSLQQPVEFRKYLTRVNFYFELNRLANETKTQKSAGYTLCARMRFHRSLGGEFAKTLARPLTRSRRVCRRVAAIVPERYPLDHEFSRASKECAPNCDGVVVVKRERSAGLSGRAIRYNDKKKITNWPQGRLGAFPRSRSRRPV